MIEPELSPARREGLGPLQALARVAAMFYAPRRASAEIRENPNWAFPLLLSILFSFLTAAAVFSRPEWQQVLENALAASGRAIGELERVKLLVALRGIAWFGALAAPVIGNLILTLILWGIAILLEGKTRFLPVFSFQLHAQMVTLVPQIAAALILLRGTDPGRARQVLPTSSAYFLPADGISPGLLAFASALDLFSIWYWVLVVVGFAVVIRLPGRRILPPVALLWAAGILLKSALSALASSVS